MDDNVPEVRDACALSFACMLKCFGMKKLASYLERIDKQRHSKVLDLYSRLIDGEPLSSFKTKPSPFSRSSSSIADITADETPLKLTKAALTSTISRALSRNPSESSLNEACHTNPFVDENARDYAENLFGEDSILLLADPFWKNRLEGLTNIKQKVMAMSNLRGEPIIRFLLRSVGWKEKNFQVLDTMIEIFSFIAGNKFLNQAAVHLITGGLVNHIADNKLKKVIILTLKSIAIATSLDTVLSESFIPIKQMKAPKILGEALLWMGQIIQDFNGVSLKLKNIVEFLKDFLTNTSPGIRSASVFVTVNLIRYYPGVRDMVRDMPSIVLSQIDSEVAKERLEEPVFAKKIHSIPASKIIEKGLDLEFTFDSEIIDRLNDLDWKIRKYALDEVSEKLNNLDGNFRPNLSSDFVSSYKARLSDTNKIVSATAVDILGNLAKCVGRPFEKYISSFIPAILSQLADQKSIVRSTVLITITIIVEIVGFAPLLFNVITSLNMDQPQVRKDLLHWIIENSIAVNADNVDVMSLIPPFLGCLLDRNSDVRKLAQAALLVVGQSVEGNAIKSKAADLYHGAQYTALIPYLEQWGSDSDILIRTLSSPKSGRSKNTKSKQGLEAKDAQTNEIEMGSELSVLILTTDLRGKEVRSLADKGVMKWSFDTPRKELVLLLKEQSAPHFQQKILNLMFSEDIQREKDYTSALQQLDLFITEGGALDRSEIIQRSIANCDLILRYLTLRFFDSNTTIFIKSLDFLDNFFTALEDGGYSLSEFEATSFIPFFVNKAG